MRDAVIVSAVRTAVGKAGKGSLKDWHPVDMGAAVVREALRRCPEAKEDEIEDVIIGSAVPEAEQGMNMARLIALRAGLPTSVPGVTVNRYCASGLQTIAMAAERIRCGAAEMIVAGGVESMSLVPMEGNKVALNPYLAQHMPQAYMSMGHTAEEVADASASRGKNRIALRFAVTAKRRKRSQKADSSGRSSRCRRTESCRLSLTRKSGKICRMGMGCLLRTNVCAPIRISISFRNFPPFFMKKER